MNSQNSSASSRQKKLKLIDRLVLRARNGHRGSLKVLLSMFDPLILKIATRIHHRMHGKVSIDEIYHSGKQEFMRLTLVVYTPDGRAHFNRFVESCVHAELWKFFRPFSKETLMDNDTMDYFSAPAARSMDSSTCELANYAMINLNQSEKTVIKDCVMNGVSCVHEAQKLGLSKVRISQIKSAAIKKLNTYMKDHGIVKEDLG